MSKAWPIIHSPEVDYGPVSYREPIPEVPLRTILEQAWESWQEKEDRNGNK